MFIFLKPNSVYFLLFLSTIIIFFYSCDLKTSAIVLKRLPELTETENVLVFSLEDAIKYESNEVIGDINIGEAGLSVKCSYEHAVDLAKQKARQMGANAIKIYKHDSPNYWTNYCHYIKAKAIHLENPWQFEDDIYWHPKRRLKIRDFRGDTSKKSALAETSSGIGYNYVGKFNFDKGHVDVICVFHRKESFFKIDEDSLYVLAHEQLHFDISELYARKFVKIIKTEVPTYKMFIQKHDSIFKRLKLDWSLRQSTYDLEVYRDTTAQKHWVAKIDKELKNLSIYVDKRVNFR
jgi:hypothetical protein